MSVTSIVLPALKVHAQRSCGSLVHVIEDARRAQVTATGTIKVSARTSEQLWTLDNGEKIVVTNRSKLELPDGADGVLRQTGSHSVWLSHKKIVAVEERVVSDGWAAESARIRASWSNFRYSKEQRAADGTLVANGLRRPQYAALHSIAARWSAGTELSTVVMPTGTGKTETMIGALVAETDGVMMVVVPNRALKDQSIRKFGTLGLLRELGCLGADARNPIIARIEHRPVDPADLDFLVGCNVVIGNIQALAQGTAADRAGEMAALVSVLVVDEAHHIAAKTWNEFRSSFASKRVLQFTATPYRRDGQLVDGEVISSYSLSEAQRDGYFKPITFDPVHEIDVERGDVEIARRAIAQLEKDLGDGLDHLVMARCESIERATAIYNIYSKRAAKHSPILVHSKMAADAELQKLIERKSRIVVCVDMLGEGFDLPNLKIAAVHDTHKSLAILLQFTGRFTRVAGPTIGNATVIANIATQNVSDALERLYSEDADWNKLLREFSSEAMKTHHEFVQFLANSKRLDERHENKVDEISNSLLRPKFSAVAFSAASYDPSPFFHGLGAHLHLGPVWEHASSNTLYFVTKEEPSVEWTRAKDLRELRWALHIVQYSAASRMLFICSSDKGFHHERLAKAVSKGTAEPFEGDVVFRVLGRMNRLMLQTVGVKKYGRRNLRYAMYTGAEVQNVLTASEKTGSVKSNLAGSGWENGKLVRLGCSSKGRIWAPVEAGTIPQLVTWCADIGAKLRDATIDTASIIKNVLIPRSITTLPKVAFLSLDWPVEMLYMPEERVVLSTQGRESPFWEFDIDWKRDGITATSYLFAVRSDTLEATFRYELGADDTFTVTHVDGPVLTISAGKYELKLADYFSNFPPLLRFVDLSELDGPMLLAPEDLKLPTIDDSCFDAWDWTGTKITVESIWRKGVRRSGSIQERAATHYITNGYDVVFDDDGPGEAADLVCLRELSDEIRLTLVHCKFSDSDDPGERVVDVVEVCSQAIRSAKRIWKFRELCRHLLQREKKAPRPNSSRFLKGNGNDLTRIQHAARFKKLVSDVVVVQPGLSMANRTEDQTLVLAAAQTFLRQTVDVDLVVVCSV
ncbi:MAG: DEAD/DEAH box helicase [Kofleriaceae bacterium]